ncbi:chondrocyte-derived ezrin-like domain containing protein isoform X1 [Amblyomma americanum]
MAAGCPPEGPGGSSSPTQEGGRQAGGSRTLAVQVHLLDDTVATFNVQYKAAGRVLFDQVCRVINLLEVDYFGLEYADSSGTKYWLDSEKPMCRQMGLSMVSPVMYFAVKFYTPDPGQLEEEFTRYLFSLQIKKDLAQGVLQCSEPTAALLASYIVQASCGDYVAEDYPDASYLSSYKFVPQQDTTLEQRIMECHQRHVGQSPAQADLNLLETARRCELYGVRLSPARDSEGLALNLAVAHMGVMVFQGTTRINTFSWAKIRKLSFKRKRFLIKLHPEGYGYYKDTVEYFFESRNECKNFWKKCIEHHAFFRCTEVKKSPRQKARLFSRGSSFRYSGRTQKQIVEYVRENYVKRQPFQRSTSLRLPSRGSAGGTSDNEDYEPTQLAIAATSEPSSPQRDTSRETPRPTEGAVTPSQDTDDNISHDSYRLEEGDSSIAAPDISIALDLSPPTALAVCPSPSTTPLKERREQGPPPENNNLHYVSSDGIFSSPCSKQDPAGDACKKVFPPEYFISKELLMTERSYKNDIEVVVVAFRDWAEKLSSSETASLFSLLAPIYKLHCGLLHELEQHMTSWDGKTLPAPGVGALMLDYLHLLELDERYLEKLPAILDSLYAGPHAERLCREFELQRDCYLPLSLFLLRPVHRVFIYASLFERLLSCYATSHTDLTASQDVLQQLRRFTGCHAEALHRLENRIKMMELDRDLVGLDNLVQPGREFVREGCLQKLSRKGYQQRMFFLFSDVLIYASRVSSSTGPRLQFKVHGQLPLQGLMVEETEPKAEAAFRFTIYAANRALLVAAGSEEERQRWMHDLGDYIEMARDNKGLYYTSLKSCHSSDERLDRSGADGPRLTNLGQSPVHATTTLHLCWHRNTSIGRYQYQQAFLHYLSGYLLRKFKNSSGWQKLWVVFSNFCLFFYKSFQESVPLASLPLLGYVVALPGDQMGKQHVFKLQYRSHVYFFRAESEYAFQRWIHVISSAAVKQL